MPAWRREASKRFSKCLFRLRKILVVRVFFSPGDTQKTNSLKATQPLFLFSLSLDHGLSDRALRQEGRCP